MQVRSMIPGKSSGEGCTRSTVTDLLEGGVMISDSYTDSIDVGLPQCSQVSARYITICMIFTPQ